MFGWLVITVNTFVLYRSALTPYYTEDVLFSIKSLEKPNEDGVSILFYLQKIYPGQCIIVSVKYSAS